MRLFLYLLPFIAGFLVFEIVMIMALMKTASEGDRQDELILEAIHHYQQKAETTEN